jgi:hypothetical protein
MRVALLILTFQEAPVRHSSRGPHDGHAKGATIRVTGVRNQESERQMTNLTNAKARHSLSISTVLLRIFATLAVTFIALGSLSSARAALGEPIQAASVGWWWYYGQSPGQVSSLLSENNGTVSEPARAIIESVAFGCCDGEKYRNIR